MYCAPMSGCKFQGNLPVVIDAIVRVDTEDIVIIETAGHVVGDGVPELVVLVVDFVLDGAKQEHALESREDEEEHGDANAGIEAAGRTV